MTERLETLAKLAADVPADLAIVEIGVNLGKSAITMAKATQARVYAVDLWDMRTPSGATETWRDSRGFTSTQVFHEFLRNVTKAEVAERITWIKGDSAEIGKAWSRPIGLLHIDGAHDPVSVCRDYERWAPYVVEGGWLCMDDAGHPQKVGRVIAETVMPSRLWVDARLVEDRLFVARRVSG